MDSFIFVFQLIVALLSGLVVFVAIIQTIDNFASLIKHKCLTFIYTDETKEDGYIEVALYWKNDKKKILSFLCIHTLSMLCFAALFIYMIMELFS